MHDELPGTATKSAAAVQLALSRRFGLATSLAKGMRKTLCSVQYSYGLGYVMRPLFFNLIAFARDLVVLTNAHATFHLGDDTTWSKKEYTDDDEFNRRECLNVIEAPCKRDPALESHLTPFVHATEEHLWILCGCGSFSCSNARPRARAETGLSAQPNG